MSRSIISFPFLLLSVMTSGQATLKVSVFLNKPQAGGILRIAFCPDKKAFDSEQGCVWRTLEANGTLITTTFEDVKPGTCAIKVFHDINADGVLNTNRIGWPQEPYGCSNDAPVNMGPPPFRLAMITVHDGMNPVRIALR